MLIQSSLNKPIPVLPFLVLRGNQTVSNPNNTLRLHETGGKPTYPDISFWPDVTEAIPRINTDCCKSFHAVGAKFVLLES